MPTPSGAALRPQQQPRLDRFMAAVVAAWERSGMSLRELARKSGYDAGTLSRWMRGELSPKTIDADRVMTAIERASRP